MGQDNHQRFVPCFRVLVGGEGIGGATLKLKGIMPWSGSRIILQTILLWMLTGIHMRNIIDFDDIPMLIQSLKNMNYTDIV
jgi:hypothetical protein